MTEWKSRRFWKEAVAVETEGGFGVLLDNRPVRTPGKAALALPTLAAARAVAAEWAAQGEAIDPRTMPFTRAANSAIERVAPQLQEVAQYLADYADSDLTCYRAAAPVALAERQAAAWDPLLDWAAATHGARLIPVEGVIHQPQNPDSRDRLARPVRAMSAFELTALSDLVGLTGSLVIGLAATGEDWPLDLLWRTSRIDEIWQQEQWGIDDEAAAVAEGNRRAFEAAARFYRLCRKNTST